MLLLRWKNQNHTTRLNADTRDNDSDNDDDKVDMDNKRRMRTERANS